MAINPLSGINSALQGTQGGNNSAGSLGEMDFLKLLVTQLQNQDPLNPQDGTEFATQLAQFTSLEQMIQMNQAMEDLSLTSQSLNNMSAISLIGKEVVTEGQTVVVNNGRAGSIQYDLSDGASNVTVSVLDGEENVIYLEELGSQREGAHSFNWNGRNSNGTPVADGAYTFEITAVNGRGEPVGVSSRNSFEVDGVKFIDGVTYLEVDGSLLPLNEVVSVQQSRSGGEEMNEQL